MKTTEFQIFIKPVGSACNLNCRYCYYLSKRDLYPGTSHFLMPDDVLREYIRQHIDASAEDIISFSWHGGEPLLAGIDFYRKALEFQSAFKPAGKTIMNGIQTNGTLINTEWAGFLAREKFSVGISLDGPEEFHNANRLRGSKGTFRKVVDGYELLRQHGITAEILCVVNSQNVKYPVSVYSFFKELKPEYITFIPLVEPDSSSANRVSVDTVPSEEFGIFLSKIFDDWVENDIGKIKIQIFEEALRTAFGQEHTLCIFKKECGAVPVIEHNGDFFSCDHFVNERHLQGNIMTGQITDFLCSTNQVTFGKSKLSILPKYCLECEVRSMCNGECPKNRFILTPYGEKGLNYLCNGYKYFFNHCGPFVKAVADVWKDEIH
jgi:uncharacterized protein